jgi:hypothetical protein
MMRTPDGRSRLELSRFLDPPIVADHRSAPVNALGYLRVMFAVDDLDETSGVLAGGQVVWLDKNGAPLAAVGREWLGAERPDLQGFLAWTLSLDAARFAARERTGVRLDRQQKTPFAARLRERERRDSNPRPPA